MSIWQRIKHWFARPDPNDIDSDFLRTTGIGWNAEGDMRAPGPDTLKDIKASYGPSYWDNLPKGK